MEEKVKLVYSAVGDHVLLFDLNTDPMEQHNLAEDPDWQERKAKLWKLLLEHTAQYTPEALDENGQFTYLRSARFPGDMPDGGLASIIMIIPWIRSTKGNG